MAFTKLRHIISTVREAYLTGGTNSSVLPLRVPLVVPSPSPLVPHNTLFWTLNRPGCTYTPPFVAQGASLPD